MESIKHPFFSIIVPIYNVEQYLRKCVESVTTQTFDDFEIILVDDGSPDNCPSICDELATNDNRIRVIHKANGGSSSARNAGTDKACGEYIIYIDSDDYWNDDKALEMIYNKITKIGVVDALTFNNYDYSCITDKMVKCSRHYDIEKLERSSKTEVLKYIFHNNLFPGAAWVMVTRRDFLIKNKIAFIEGIKAEDVDWLLNVYLNADTYSAINNSFYVYLKYRNGSITSTADKKSINDLLLTLEIWVKKLKNPKYKEVKNDVLGFLVNHYLCAVLIYDKLPREQKSECKKQLSRFKFITNYSPSYIIKLLGRFPISWLSKMCGLYRKTRRF